MDPLLTSGFYCTSPQAWCATPPPLLAIPAPDSTYLLAFRLPLLEKMDAICKSRSRFHTFNHCQYCTRDLIFLSLLQSDVFAIDRPQLLTILKKGIPENGKFACKGHVEQWLGIIDIGSIATVEKLPVFHNRAESMEYFFLQNNLFKMFAHLLEDSCTEVLDEVRPDLVNMLDDLRQNEHSFKVIITSSQNQFRNSLTQDIASSGNSSGIGICGTYPQVILDGAGLANPSAVPITTANGSMWTHSPRPNPDSYGGSGSCNGGINDIGRLGNLAAVPILKTSQLHASPFLSPTANLIFPSLLQATPTPVPQQHFIFSPGLHPVTSDDHGLYSKRHPFGKLRRKKSKDGIVTPEALVYT